MSAVVAGLFVGGRGTRMGGRPKGLLRAPDGRTLVDRSRSLLEALGLPVVLVGVHEAYEDLAIPAVPDDPPGIGPLGGLVALLRHAGQGRVIALACDMAHVSGGLLERLLAHADAPIVAPRRDGRWEPLCAVYDAGRVLPLAAARAASQRHSLQGLLDDAGAVALALTAAEQANLRDWDTPEDVVAD